MFVSKILIVKSLSLFKKQCTNFHGILHSNSFGVKNKEWSVNEKHCLRSVQIMGVNYYSDS